jgi:hypothetical protein
MDDSKLHIKVAFLWILMAISMSAHTILMGADPAAIKSNTEWAINAKSFDWIFMTMFWLIPIWMAFLSISLNDSFNHILNLCMAVIFIFINLWHLFICGVPLLKGAPYIKPTIHHILLLFSSIIATLLIIQYSLKWIIYSKRKI